MKRLLLLRHAKAEALSDRGEDFARALSARGMEDAAAMARHLVAIAGTVDLLLVSGALRTRQTAEAVLRVLRPSPSVEYRDELYLTGAGTLLSAARALPDALQGVMLVGHNPGLQALAVRLTQVAAERDEESRRLLQRKFPTAALAVLDFPVNRWRDLCPGAGALACFVKPKDI